MAATLDHVLTIPLPADADFAPADAISRRLRATNGRFAELERIAQVHNRLGIADAFYDLWLDALVSAVREYDEQADEATELAWRWALTPGITYMRLLNRLPDSLPATKATD